MILTAREAWYKADRLRAPAIGFRDTVADKAWAFSSDSRALPGNAEIQIFPGGHSGISKAAFAMHGSAHAAGTASLY